MIKKLQQRFIKIAMLSVVGVLTAIVLAINVIFCIDQFGHSEDILLAIAAKDNASLSPDESAVGIPLAARYFVVTVDSSKTVMHIDTDHIIGVDSDTIGQITSEVIAKGKQSGFASGLTYRYHAKSSENGTAYYFLNIESDVNRILTVLDITVAVSLAAVAVVFALVVHLSYRAIAPVIEAEDKQKQFIADAGHEIKTPLAIISANADVLELEVGQSEWLTGIKTQTKRLSKLVASLLELTTMEQKEQTLSVEEFDISDALLDVAEDFKVLAISKNKELHADIQPDITYKGDEAALRQLFGLLIENSVKYAMSGTAVQVSLQRQSDKIIFTVQNSIAEPIPKRQLVKLFHRFYRADASRNSSNGGYGIGLSIAQSIVHSHGGRITATCPRADLIEFKTIL